MASNVVHVGDVEIMMLSDGMLEFDLCNFFPTIAEDNWSPYEAHLHEHKVRFNLGSYLIRAGGRTVLIDTGLGPKPAETPDAPWGQLMNDFKAKAVRPEEIDMVVMTHLHRDHVGLESQDRGREIRADVSAGALLDAEARLGFMPRSGPAADPVGQRAAVRVAARRPRALRVHAGRAEPDARAHRSADARPHAGTHEHSRHLER